MFYFTFFLGSIFSILNKKSLFYIFTAIILIMAIFRYGIGADYFSYLLFYENLKVNIINEFLYGVSQQEIGFRLYGSFLKSLGFSYKGFLATIAIINIVFLALTAKKYSFNPTLTIFIYFCLYYFIWTYSGLRQGIVITVGIYYLLESIFNNKNKKFIIITVFLIFIHSSALFLFILFCISKLKLQLNHLYIFTIFCICFSFFPIQNLIRVFSIFPLYSEVKMYIDNYSISNVLDFKAFSRCVLLFGAFYFYKSYAKISEMSKKIMQIYIISLSAYFLFQFSELTAARLTIYGQYLNIIIIANIIYTFRYKLVKVMYIYLITIFLILYFYKSLMSLNQVYDYKYGSTTFITPYVHVFNKDDYIYYLSDFEDY